jgi:hypothetical protein
VANTTLAFINQTPPERAFGEATGNGHAFPAGLQVTGLSGLQPHTEIMQPARTGQYGDD